MMQLELLPRNLSDKKVLISLSAGINSMAVLCYLASEYPVALRPKTLYLFYAHLKEHSPGSVRFVCDGIRYAKRKFEKVIWDYTAGSVIEFFRQQHTIPHPAFSPCSEELKIIPINKFIEQHGIEIDLVGYVRTEKRRINRQLKLMKVGTITTEKYHPIRHLLDGDCFALVEREIGWYPDIYRICNDNGRRVFKHNNCLPCKNMEGRLDGNGASGEFADVAEYYPVYFAEAQSLSEELEAYWGREKGFNGHCQFCEFS